MNSNFSNSLNSIISLSMGSKKSRYILISFIEKYCLFLLINFNNRIAILGINTSIAYSRLDFFDKFMDDYYSLYRWVAKLSIERPHYKIVVIHHASAGDDIIEDKILLDSNVKVLDKNYNSYEIAFSSKLAITYGSTMGYELNAHGLPTLFVDPGFRCAFLPETGLDYIDNLRIDTYNKFKLIAGDIIENKNINNLTKNNCENFCLESSTVSNRIKKYFDKVENNNKN